MFRKMLLMIAACAVILAVTGVAAHAQQLYDPSEPGSLLVFPKFVRGTVAAGVPATEIEISVHCPTINLSNGFCTFPSNFTLRLAGHWVCPGNDAGICKETDFIVSTTVEGTINFNPDGTPVGANFATVRVPPAPCPEGYLVMWAVNSANRPFKWDALVGDAVVRWNNHAAASYKAIAVQAANTAASTGTPIALGPGGQLDFDGLDNHYAAVTGTTLATIKYDTTTPAADAPVSTSLTLLTLDLLFNRPNDTVFSDLNFYDANEFLVSEALNFTCWTEIPLSSIDPVLSRDFMSRKGLFYSVDASTGGPPVTMLGLVDTQECQGSAGCTENVPVTPTNNPTIVNHYMYLTSDDSVPVAPIN